MRRGDIPQTSGSPLTHTDARRVASYEQLQRHSNHQRYSAIARFVQLQRYSVRPKYSTYQRCFANACFGASSCFASACKILCFELLRVCMNSGSPLTSGRPLTSDISLTRALIRRAASQLQWQRYSAKTRVCASKCLTPRKAVLSDKVSSLAQEGRVVLGSPL